MQSSGGRVFKGALRGGRATRDASAAQSAVPELDTGDVLAAISSERVKDTHDLADVMNVTQSTIDPVIDDLTHKGFIEQSEGSLSLSEIGQRALTYSRMAKF